MAERKSGPVKPPVIDLTARPSAAKPADAKPADAKPVDTAPDAATHQPADTVKSPPAAKPQADKPQTGAAAPEAGPAVSDVERFMPLGIAAAGGAILGTGLTFLLANFIALPSPVAPLADPAPVLTAQSQRLDALEERLSPLQALEPRFTSLEQTATRTQVSLDATITQLDTGLTELRNAIAEAKAAIPASQSVDLSTIEDQIKALRSRVDAIAAGASTADADAMAQNIAGLEAELNKLTTGLSDVTARVGTLDTRLTDVAAAAEAVKTALAAHIDGAAASEVGPALKLPLVISGLDAGFSTGHPFTAELMGLKGVLPDLEISSLLVAHAESGLLRPDEISVRFEAVLPDMLGASRTGSKGDWIADATDWAKSLLALRPANEMEGDAPDAIVSRIEGALLRRDYIAATTLMEQLPEPMRLAAGAVADDIAARAAADALITELRARALAGSAS